MSPTFTLFQSRLPHQLVIAEDDFRDFPVPFAARAVTVAKAGDKEKT